MYFIAKTYTILIADKKAEIEKVIHDAYAEGADENTLENLEAYLTEQIDLGALISCSSQEFK